MWRVSLYPNEERYMAAAAAAARVLVSFRLGGTTCC